MNVIESRASIVVRVAIIIVIVAAGSWAAVDLRLVDAAKRQDHATMKSLIAAKIDVNAPQPDGATPLAWAAYNEDGQAVDLLLAAHADPNPANVYGETALTLACANREGKIAVKLIAAGANVNAAKQNGETALMIASRSGNVEAVGAMLSHGVKVDAIESNKGQNALMWASAAGNSAVVDLLLQHGADPGVVSKGGFSPLVFAVQSGDAKSTALLLAAHANPNFSVSNTSVLTLALSGNKPDVVRTLIENGADPNAAGPGGLMPLHSAAQAGNIDFIKLLIAKGADVNAQTPGAGAAPAVGGGGRGGGGRGGRGGGAAPAAGQLTPLMMAARAGHVDAMKTLLAAGAKPGLKADNGSTLLLEAVASGQFETIKFAFTLDSDVKAANSTGATVLHSILSAASPAAAPAQIFQVSQFMLERGAPVDAKDRTRLTPLHLAAQAGNIQLVDLLIARKADVNAATAGNPVAAASGRGAGPNAGAAGRGGRGGAAVGQLTPLMLAAKGDHVDVMKALVAAGANAKLRADNGSSVLLEAARSGHLDAVQYAYTLDPDVTTVTSTGTTLMHASVTGTGQTSDEEEICKVIQFLADKGAPVDAKDSSGQTPLLIANGPPLQQPVELLSKLIAEKGAAPRPTGKP